MRRCRSNQFVLYVKRLPARGDNIKKLVCLSLIFLTLCGCTAKENAKKPKEDNKPFIGVWISCYELDKMLSGGNLKGEFDKVCKNLETIKVTDVFLHARAFGDSLFKSRYYPQKENTKSYDFDVFKYMITALSGAGIRTHAWINPFRTAPGEFNNPADPGVRAKVLRGIREIIENYDVAGIHFDDYFYPAEDGKIDEASYKEYSKTAEKPLGKDEWRRANISALIFSVKDLLTLSDKKPVFSVSPAADIEKNRNTYFADIKDWCSEGAVDMIIPQLYFGFKYPDKRFCFDNLLKEWKKLTVGSKTKLIIGLSAYKLGTKEPPDNAEWQNGEDILSRQTEICLGDSAVLGVCFFSYSYLFSDDKLNTAAREKIKRVIIKKGRILSAPQSVKKPMFYTPRSVSYASCFSFCLCGGKTPCKRKSPLKGDFQEGVGGIGGSGVQSENQEIFGERHFRPRACRLFRHAQQNGCTRQPLCCVLYYVYAANASACAPVALENFAPVPSLLWVAPC